MKYPVLGLLLGLLFMNGFILFASGNDLSVNSPGVPEGGMIETRFLDEKDEELKRLNQSLQSLLSKRLIDSSRPVAGNILHLIDQGKNYDSRVLSDSYYLTGVFYLLEEDYSKSIRFLDLFVILKEKRQESDESMSKALFNIGLANFELGNFYNSKDYSIRALELEKNFFGESSPKLITAYASIIISCIELQEYEMAINYSNIALSISDNNPGSTADNLLADLYYNLGVCFCRLVDFSNAKIYLDKSESIYIKSKLAIGSNYYNLLNSQAVTYGALGLTEDSYKYYEKGISLAVSANFPEAYNLVNSYALDLGQNGRLNKGESLLVNALQMARTDQGPNSHTYIEVLKNYADYLREFKIDNKKSLGLYEKCIEYLDQNPHDFLLKAPVGIGYALSLNEAGDHIKALSIIQSLLFSGSGEDNFTEINNSWGKYDNPELANIKPDKKSLNILRTKYVILQAICRVSTGLEIYAAISNTSELIVSLIEKVRLNIGQEESRLILGDRYRDSYFNAIRDLNLLFSVTSDEIYLEKAFIYSEKSKVAGLLTSAREMNAGSLNIPSAIGEMEKKLQREMNLLEAHINEEGYNIEIDTVLLRKWKEDLFEASRKRDSLVHVFEKRYPGYYALKYNTNVAGLKDIPGIIGRDGNYINYLASDSMLYIFVANRKNLKLLSVPVDSAFFNKIRQFRNLLSMPEPSDNARVLFNKYQSVGYELYNILIEPACEYLISDRIIISPDNILSYLPFEALPASLFKGEGIMFREIDFLLNKFDISYAYSATFMAESAKGSFSSGSGNSTIAFAPVYTRTIDIHDIIAQQNSASFKLADLPFARQEAEYVSRLTGGKLLEGEKAKESVFKREAGRYDIIHLAMHTVVNDRDPMQSTLIFSPESADSSSDDRYLKTYEVYGIPLKAKMVVLSSCNTGSGLLSSGEGILSMARGFIYSGSKSVVMSMWEIDDRSGTEIVKMFYRNLKDGDSKSRALRKARIEYLKKADQLRSHPYFWSALVVYGDNSPLFNLRKQLVISLSVSVFACILLIYYFMKRK